LPGRWTGGPWPFGDAAIIGLDGGRLACAVGDEIRWTTEPGDLQPAAPPLVLDQKLVVTTATGKVQVVNLQSGELLGSVEIGQPLGQAFAAAENELLIAGSDGVLHRITMPGKS